MIDFTDEQKLARKMLRQWTDKELAPQVAKLEKGELLPYDLGRKLIAAFGIDEMVRTQFAKLAEAPSSPPRGDKGERGVLGDAALMAIVSMELSRVCPGFCLAFGASLGLAGGAIMAKGTLAQKQRWGLPILVGDKVGAWSMTEPGAGSDAFGNMRTSARRDGGEFVLNGQKTFITNAPFADTFVVYAKIEGVDAARARPFHAFVVDKGTPGLTVSKPMEKMGMHSSPTGEVFLADDLAQLFDDAGEHAHHASRRMLRAAFRRSTWRPDCR
jgi:alkylation response protein AidB-like acyl-CoA dehydrogenase